MNPAVLLEAVLPVSFGITWSLTNLRMLRARRPEGCGLSFTAIVLVAHLCAASAKLLIATQGGPLALVFWIYLLNSVSISGSLGLQWHYGRALAAVGEPAAA